MALLGPDESTIIIYAPDGSIMVTTQWNVRFNFTDTIRVSGDDYVILGMAYEPVIQTIHVYTKCICGVI